MEYRQAIDKSVAAVATSQTMYKAEYIKIKLVIKIGITVNDYENYNFYEFHS
jgi:hypothetical protein